MIHGIKRTNLMSMIALKAEEIEGASSWESELSSMCGNIRKTDAPHTAAPASAKYSTSRTQATPANANISPEEIKQPAVLEN
mmetsp:Transcript_107879/g.187251  ORF Transcript_107879/g.187251 Transcript_107879/m.187251 type:complete len:82 (-) Transcript_107879:456-701(-)